MNSAMFRDPKLIAVMLKELKYITILKSIFLVSSHVKIKFHTTRNVKYTVNRMLIFLYVAIF
jgi:hypothetical protein